MKKKEDFVVYRDVYVPIEVKIWHIHKIGKRVHRNFTKDIGDVPVGRLNCQTGIFECVVNTRGLAYAARNRKMYRRK